VGSWEVSGFREAQNKFAEKVNYPRLKPWASLAGQKKEDKRICSASFLAA
jgi:hypothetical protein